MLPGFNGFRSVVCEYDLVLQVKIFCLVIGIKEEQRVAIKFCVKFGNNAADTIELINKVYGSAAMSCDIVYRRYAGFRDGRKSVKTTSEVVVLRLPEQTKTWNLFVVC
jgi:hypothetical protein